MAAMLHDVVKQVEDRKLDHGLLGAEEAKAFLLKIGVDEGAVAKVYNAIYFHNREFQGGLIERQILWDADKLDVLLFSTFKSRMCPFCMWKSGGKGFVGMAERDYKFFGSRMRTKTGRAMVKKDAPKVRKYIAKLKLLKV
jgi:hypothetical protein